jgi:hypothetical protein
MGLENQSLSSTTRMRRTYTVQARRELHHKWALGGAFFEADGWLGGGVRLILVQGCLFMDLW